MGILGILGKGIAGHKVAAIVIAVIVAASTGAAIIAVEHTSTVKITVRASASAVSQTVSFNGTNAPMVSPITIGNNANVTSNTSNYTISLRTYITQNATFSVNVSRLTPGRYVKFVVALENAGYTTLDLNQTGVNLTVTPTVISNDVTISTSITVPISTLTPETVSGFEALLNGANSWQYAYGSNGVHHIDPTLLPGHSFYYSVYVGLGTNANSSTMATQGYAFALSFTMPLIVNQ